MVPGDNTVEVVHAIRRQRVAMVIVGCLVVANLCTLPRLSRIESAVLPSKVRLEISGVCPNSAEWYELAQLPGVGESLARAIVAFRERERASPGDSWHVFSKPGDLGRVSGIGDRTIHRIAPFLRFENEVGGRLVDRGQTRG